jgi:hypothetical protein
MSYFLHYLACYNLSTKHVISTTLNNNEEKLILQDNFYCKFTPNVKAKFTKVLMKTMSFKYSQYDIWLQPESLNRLFAI